MWKKIGAIGPLSNDNKSNRSRDQTAYEPFSQMSKIKLSDVQQMNESTELFCPNFLSKKKSLQNLHSPNSKIQEFSQLKFSNQNPEGAKGSLLRKKTFNVTQVEEISQKISKKIMDSFEDSIDKSQKNIIGQEKLRKTDSTKNLGSQTSIEESGMKLKHVKSTPQLNFTEPDLDTCQETLKGSTKHQVEHKNIAKFEKWTEFERKQIKVKTSEFASRMQELNNKKAEMITKIKILRSK